MSLPFVGENWEGVVVGAFCFWKNLANYRKPKRQITAKPHRLWAMWLAVSHIALNAAAVTSARFACRHVLTLSSILRGGGCVFGPPEEQPLCTVAQAFDGATLLSHWELTRNALSSPWL